MSLVNNLLSPPILKNSQNTWPGGDSIQLLSPIISDISTLATAIDAIDPTSGTLKADIILPKTPGGGTSITRPVITGAVFATTNVLTASQSGALCIQGLIAGTKFILPAATVANTGVWFEFYTTATVTSNSASIWTASSSDLFIAGSAITQILVATPVVTVYSPNGSSNYKIDANGSTKGGIIGDRYFIICTGLNSWLVTGTQTQTGSTATPFAG